MFACLKVWYPQVSPFLKDLISGRPRLGSIQRRLGIAHCHVWFCMITMVSHLGNGSWWGHHWTLIALQSNRAMEHQKNLIGKSSIIYNMFHSYVSLCEGSWYQLEMLVGTPYSKEFCRTSCSSLAKRLTFVWYTMNPCTTKYLGKNKRVSFSSMQCIKNALVKIINKQIITRLIVLNYVLYSA